MIRAGPREHERNVSAREKKKRAREKERERENEGESGCAGQTLADVGIGIKRRVPRTSGSVGQVTDRFGVPLAPALTRLPNTVIPRCRTTWCLSISAAAARYGSSATTVSTLESLKCRFLGNAKSRECQVMLTQIIFVIIMI